MRTLFLISSSSFSMRANACSSYLVPPRRYDSALNYVAVWSLSPSGTAVTSPVVVSVYTRLEAQGDAGESDDP